MITSRRVPAAVIVLVVAGWVVPLRLTEAYPFTAAPMFRDDFRRYCVYDVTGGPTLEELGLHVAYIGNPEDEAGSGRILPQPLHRFGEVPDLDGVVRRVAERLAPGQRVTVRRTVFAGRPDGSFGEVDVDVVEVVR